MNWAIFIERALVDNGGDKVCQITRAAHFKARQIREEVGF